MAFKVEFIHAFLKNITGVIARCNMWGLSLCMDSYDNKLLAHSACTYLPFAFIYVLRRGYRIDLSGVIQKLICKDMQLQHTQVKLLKLALN